MNRLLLVIGLWMHFFQVATPTATPGFDLEAERNALGQALTAARATQGLAPLLREPRLDQAAQGQADWIASSRQYSHVGANGSTPGDRVASTGYQTSHGYWVEEGFAVARSPQEAVSLWMSDRDHRALVLESRLGLVGIGVTPNPGGWGNIYIMDLAGPPDSTITPTPATPTATPTETVTPTPTPSPLVVTVIVTQVVTVVVTPTPGIYCVCQETETPTPSPAAPVIEPYSGPTTQSMSAASITGARSFLPDLPMPSLPQIVGAVVAGLLISLRGLASRWTRR